MHRHTLDIRMLVPEGLHQKRPTRLVMDEAQVLGALGPGEKLQPPQALDYALHGEQRLANGGLLAPGQVHPPLPDQPEVLAQPAYDGKLRRGQLFLKDQPFQHAHTVAAS